MEAIQSPIIAFVIAYGLESFRKGQLFSSAALGNGLQIGLSVWLGRTASRRFTAPSLDLISSRQISSDAIAGVVYALLRKVWGDKAMNEDGALVNVEKFGPDFGYGFGIALASSVTVPFLLPGLSSFAGLKMARADQIEINTWNTFGTGNALPTFNPGCGTTAATQFACLWPSTKYDIFG